MELSLIIEQKLVDADKLASITDFVDQIKLSLLIRKRALLQFHKCISFNQSLGITKKQHTC